MNIISYAIPINNNFNLQANYFIYYNFDKKDKINFKLDNIHINFSQDIKQINLEKALYFNLLFENFIAC